MTPQSWPELDRILQEALERPIDARAAFLDQACAGDPELRREVESLLWADAAAGDFLSHPIRIDLGDPGDLRLAPRTVVADRYRIVRRLGLGGMGEVYQADDLKLGGPVALKFLGESWARDRSMRERFLREVKLARQVTHPNVCRVYDVGEAGGQQFLSMEYIDGEDLASRLDRTGRAERGEALEIARQLCRGLAAVHAQGILHCDLKPSNLMIDAAGTLRITDFGIAELAGHAAPQRSSPGTPAYMAPEQHTGGEVSRRTDLYALGLVIFELVTGRRAFRGKTSTDLARLHRQTPPPSPSSLIRDLDPAVESAILRCLEKDPANRPASAEDVEAVLTRGSRPAAATPWTAPIRALNQLPPPAADFTGRQAELDALLGFVEAEAAIVSIQGMGGLGKTTLALKLAEELTPRFGDGQIYLDLRGVDAKPLDAVRVMAHVLHSFRPQARLPDDEARIAALYRSQLHGRRVLLFFDNAAGREQVEPLIPPRRCLLLVTSRRAFTLPGMETVSLESMSPEESTAFLSRTVRGIGAGEAREIALSCGYLPIALRLAGATLAERRDLSPAEYAGRLAEGRGRLDLIEASLTLSYELLDPELRRLWCCLAVFSGPFDRAAAAAVWNLDGEVAEGPLGELVKNGLTEYSDGRYRLHDLARLFAADRLDGEERRRLDRRHAQHYRHVLQAANDLYARGGDDVVRGFRRLDAEWANIQTGQAWSQGHAADDPAVAALCSAYAEVGHRILFRSPLHMQMEWQSAGLDAARRSNDRWSIARHLAHLGWALIVHGEPLRSRKMCGEAIGIAREISDRETEALALGHLGLSCHLLGEPRRAIEIFEQALALARDLGDRRAECAQLTRLSSSLESIGETRRGVDYLEEALAIAREIGNRYLEGGCLGGLGWYFFVLGETRRGRRLMEQSLYQVRELGYRYEEGHSLTNLAWALIELGEPRRGVELAEQAAAIAREISSPFLRGHALVALGRAHWRLGKLRSARSFLEQAMKGAREVGDRRTEGEAAWALGRLYEEAGELERAVEHMRIRADFERSIGHVDAEKRAARIEAIRARLQ